MATFQYNVSNMEEGKSIFTMANDCESTTTTATDCFSTTDRKGSISSSLAEPFQSHVNTSTLPRMSSQKRRTADSTSNTEDFGEDFIKIPMDRADSLFGDERNFFADLVGNSGAASVASAHRNNARRSVTSRSDNIFDGFEFLLKTFSSAHTYVSMLSLEQMKNLQSMRPNILHVLLLEVSRVRTDVRTQRALPNECAFCKNNGENEELYSSHELKDWRGRVKCPVLRVFRCPCCGATGDNAHTIKYCPMNDIDSGRSGNRRYFLRTNSKTDGSSFSGASISSNSATSSLNSNIWSNFGIN